MPRFAFPPSTESGLAARRGVQQRLAESLAHTFEQAAPAVAFDRQRGEAIVRALGDGVRFGPRLVALYFDLVQAIQRNDRDALPAAFARLLAETPIAGQDPRLVVFGGEGMTAAEQTLIGNQFSSDGLDGATFGPLPPDLASAAKTRFAEALQLLVDAAPATYAEMKAVIAEIVLTGSVAGRSGHRFRASSSLQYWGAIVINAVEKKSLLEICESLAHESAHNALFGFSPRHFFVLNRDDERHVSPLREDPRPLDGIFHAVFVLARMHHAVSELLRSGRLTADQREEAQAMLRTDLRAFAEGRQVLESHARFTDDGREILAAAADYMSLQ